MDGNRRVVWSIRDASGEQFLYYRATVRPSGRERPETGGEPPRVAEHGFAGPELIAAGALLAGAREQSADDETLIGELVRRLNDPRPDGNVALLVGRNPTVLQRMETAVRILASAGLPARVLHGVRLQELIRHAPLAHWLEVHHQGAWRAYHPVTGEQGLPEDFLAWWHGPRPLARTTGARQLSTQLSVSVNKESALQSAAWRERFTRPMLFEYSLLGLPIHTQAVYHVLLTVPLGVFLLVILRNVVGIKTFGTFMPVLIALAFRETQLIWGIVLFSLVVGLGLSIRFYLERLKLLLVPRLAAVLIVVIVLMALLSLLSYRLGLHRGLSVALFPMVIMTMTIERMSIVWEERGAAEALQQGLGSLLVASLAYLTMNIAMLQHIIFVFPELLLVLLAATILLGRYSGYRLSELRRFKVLARERT